MRHTLSRGTAESTDCLVWFERHLVCHRILSKYLWFSKHKCFKDERMERHPWNRFFQSPNLVLKLLDLAMFVFQSATNWSLCCVAGGSVRSKKVHCFGGGCGCSRRARTDAYQVTILQNLSWKYISVCPAKEHFQSIFCSLRRTPTFCIGTRPRIRRNHGRMTRRYNICWYFVVHDFSNFWTQISQKAVLRVEKQICVVPCGKDYIRSDG